VFIADDTGVIVYHNNTAERLLALERPLLGSQLDAILPGSARQALERLRQQPDADTWRQVGELGHGDTPVAMSLMTRQRDGHQYVVLAAVQLAQTGEQVARLRWLEKALDTMQVGVSITDVERTILYVNQAEADMHGYTRPQLVGEHVSIFAPPDLHNPMSPEQLVKVRTWRRESINLRKDGSQFPVEMLSDLVLDDQGQPEGVVSICQDITTRIEAEQALRESEERYALALAGANDGIWDWDVKTGSVFFSQRWAAMLGLTAVEAPTCVEDWYARFHPEDIEELKTALEQHLKGETQHFENEHRMMHADGSYRWMLSRGAAIRDPQGTASRLAGSQTDITDRKVRDPLTRLPNRALFLDHLRSAMGRARRRQGPTLAVMFLDLDRFKVVNDSLGHVVGDHVLVKVARELETCVRPGDTLARLGGDEFTLLVEEISSGDDAIAVASRVLDKLNHSHEVVGHIVFAPASIGIVLFDEHYQSPEEMLQDADTAMYAAKELGGSRFAVFDADMRTDVQRRMQLETELRQAVEHEEFVLHYQPIITLDTQHIVGFEALIRWSHPTRGLLSPLEFISIADETGLIVDIGAWVLLEACRQLARLQQELPPDDHLCMCVNVSPRQFAHPDIVRTIEQVLSEVSIAPECLQLEITESLFIGDAATVQKLWDLRAMGVRVCIDDFGTGYSSLSYLQRLPVDGLKIDRSFIEKLSTDSRTVEMVKTIIKLAADLGLEVIAEGVEKTTEQAQLQRLSCRYMQGYGYSKPLAEDRILPLLQQNRSGAIPDQRSDHTTE